MSKRRAKSGAWVGAPPCRAPALCRKRVPYPVDSWICCPHFAHGEHIEPHAEPGQLPALLQELRRRPDEASLFARVDAGRRPTELLARPRTHLGDYQYVAIARHDVQLAQPAAEVALENFETLAPEEASGNLLSRGAHKLFCGPPARGSAAARAGCRLPCHDRWFICRRGAVAVPPAPVAPVVATTSPHRCESTPSSNHGARAGPHPH
jgi:hypothetical protein